MDLNKSQPCELASLLEQSDSPAPSVPRRELKNDDQLWNAILRVHEASCGSSDLCLEQQNKDVAWIRRRIEQWYSGPTTRTLPTISDQFDILVRRIAEVVLLEWEERAMAYVKTEHMVKNGDNYEWKWVEPKPMKDNGFVEFCKLYPDKAELILGSPEVKEAITKAITTYYPENANVR
jgi:hypothetical protein